MSVGLGLVALALVGCEDGKKVPPAAASGSASSPTPPRRAWRPHPLGRRRRLRARRRRGHPRPGWPVRPPSRARGGLGTRTDEIADLRAWGDRIYALAYSQPAARGTLAYFARDGSEKGEVGNHQGLGEPRSFGLTHDWAYFTQKRGVFRFPLAGGNAERVQDGFADQATVLGDQLFGMRCAVEGKVDQLVRAPASGGAEKVVAAVAPKSSRCRYGDIAVDGTHAFVTDFEGRRLLSIPLSGGDVTELSSGNAFAAAVFLVGQDVVYSAQGGLYRVARTGGPEAKLTEWGNSPWGIVAYDGADFWMFQGMPYEMKEHIYTLPQTGTEAQSAWTFSVTDTTAGSGVRAFTVDDQCYYHARKAPNGEYSSIHAHRKQP